MNFHLPKSRRGNSPRVARPAVWVESLERRQLLTLTVNDLTAIEGIPFNTQVIATFRRTDFPIDPGGSPNNYAATINWGDQQVSTGGIIADGLNFDVTGSHTYRTPTAGGPSNVIRVTVSAVNNSDLSATGSAFVGYASITSSGVPVSGVKGNPFSGVVAVFQDGNPTLTSSDFSATINWGDGSTPTTDNGFVSTGSTPGTFNVQGTHTFLSSGSFTVTTTIVRGSRTSITNSTANVAFAPSKPALSSTGQFLAVMQDQPLASDTLVGTFTYTPPPNSPAPIFTAVIDWGDGHATVVPAANVVFNSSTKAYEIRGSNTYQLPGTYAVNITVQDQFNNSTTIKSTAVVTPATSSTAVFQAGLDSGGSASSTNRPTFAGTANPFALVQLSARLSGVDATLPLGQTIADSNGHWSLLTGPLAQGLYTVTAVVTPSSGSPSSPFLVGANGLIAIDTTPPRVVGVFATPGRDQVYVNFRDDLSGLSLASLLDRSNYTLTGPGNSLGVHPLSVTLLASAGLPTDVQGVLLTIPNVKSRRFLRNLRIKGLGITDTAGNALGNDFHGSVVTVANGRASGNVIVKLGGHAPKGPRR